ncbi:hypothetical protein AURDEDRAFT_116909 [Auricularia subglabra TFB-10046 SS5]|uniref:Uncharacterized protein n=1 Tax=Auricularia subglabra (strain TFB-10046 / SS5) TaxID=717982 RepID=J0WU58_AURST|nr:hypothetical protein AURDEDRAFT_116909 [Auricularia subglabra TFB-10046 SS5]
MAQYDGGQEAAPGPSGAAGTPTAERLTLLGSDAEAQQEVAAGGESGEDVEVRRAVASAQLGMLRRFQMVQDEGRLASCLSQAHEECSISHDPAAEVDDAETQAHVASATPGPSGSSSNSYTSHSAAAQEPDARPDAEFWERVSTPKVNKTKEYKVLVALDDEDLLAVVPYGNGFCRRPLLERASATTLYKLTTKTAWSKIETGRRVTVEHMERLRGDAARDADMLELRMASDTAEGIAVRRIRLIVLGRLDTLIAAHKGQVAPQLPADAQYPQDEKVMTALRRPVHNNDWISCVWCGQKREAREDKNYVREHLEKVGKIDHYCCPFFRALKDKGLVDAWRRKHINGVHQHDRWIFDKPAAQPGCEEREKLARAAAAEQQQEVGQESSVGKAQTNAKSATSSRGPHPYRRA